MSTRCNITVSEGKDTLWFYRHSDGYPEGAMPTLDKFMQAVADGKIRTNISQASGWLVWFGSQEYGSKEPSHEGFDGWKVGSIEPTTGEHGDIEYLYKIDLDNLTVSYHDENGKKVVKKYKAN